MQDVVSLQGCPLVNLNAGCGRGMFGDVRLDSSLTHRYDLDSPRNAANFRGDVCHLPFRNRVFVSTRCYYTLEHLDDPQMAIQAVRLVTSAIRFD